MTSTRDTPSNPPNISALDIEHDGYYWIHDSSEKQPEWKICYVSTHGGLTWVEEFGQEACPIDMYRNNAVYTFRGPLSLGKL